jgi:serine/threonine protein kinase
VNANDNAFLQTCRHCHHEFRAHAKLVGKTVPCPYCRRPIDIVASQPPADDRLVGQEIGGNRLLRRLGAGALGVVYEAKQLSVGRRVALKMLSSKAAADKEIVQRFEREAKICAAIRHPGVVGVYDCGHDRGVHFLTMEFIDGITFAGVIEAQGRLPWQEAAKYIQMVAKALEHIHGQSIIHRDIKPANILVDNSGSAKLADLGLAKQIDEEAGGGLTMQGIAMGSPAYMPPEQIRNAKDATQTADIYALGATFYQAVTGFIPFDGKNGTEVMTKVLKDPPTPVQTHVPDIPVGVADLIHKMLSKATVDRPQSATAFLALLDQVIANPDKPLAGKAPAAKAAGGGGGGSSGGMPKWLIPAIIGVVVLLAAAGAAIAFMHKGP